VEQKVSGTNDELTVYGWDYRNRLISVTTTDAMSNGEGQKVEG
jgi:hypothetical protein